jgi:hypothetical protein
MIEPGIELLARLVKEDVSSSRAAAE